MTEPIIDADDLRYAMMLSGKSLDPRTKHEREFEARLYGAAHLVLVKEVSAMQRRWLYKHSL